MFDLSTGQSQQIAQHEESIVGVKWVPQHGILVTGSWDKTVKVNTVHYSMTRCADRILFRAVLGSTNT